VEETGFAVTLCDDVTTEAMGWAARQASTVQPGGLTVATIVGPRMAEMAANFVRNLREHRVRLVMGVAEAI
jgi:hypothetical protein